MEIAEVIVELIYIYGFSGARALGGGDQRRFVVCEKVGKNKLRVAHARTLPLPPVIRQLMRSSLRPRTDPRKPILSR